jgi:hypothetical protein
MQTHPNLSLVPISSESGAANRGLESAEAGVPAAGRGVHAAPLSGNPYQLLLQHERLVHAYNRAWASALSACRTLNEARISHRVARAQRLGNLACMSRFDLAKLLVEGQVLREAVSRG